MQPHEERVVQEKAELDAKLDKLRQFLPGPVCASLPLEDFILLQDQAETMQSYSEILGKRIARFS